MANRIGVNPFWPLAHGVLSNQMCLSVVCFDMKERLAQGSGFSDFASGSLKVPQNVFQNGLLCHVSSLLQQIAVVKLNLTGFLVLFTC